MTRQTTQSAPINYWPGTYKPMGVRLRESKNARLALNTGINALVHIGPLLGRVTPLRRAVVRFAERRLEAMRDSAIESAFRPARIEQDRYDLGLALLHTIERALGEDLLSEGMRRTLLCTLVHVVHGHPPQLRFTALR